MYKLVVIKSTWSYLSPSGLGQVKLSEKFFVGFSLIIVFQ